MESCYSLSQETYWKMSAATHVWYSRVKPNTKINPINRILLVENNDGNRRRCLGNLPYIDVQIICVSITMKHVVITLYCLSDISNHSFSIAIFMQYSFLFYHLKVIHRNSIYIFSGLIYIFPNLDKLSFMREKMVSKKRKFPLVWCDSTDKLTLHAEKLGTHESIRLSIL